MLLLRAVAGWFALLVIAIGTATVREGALAPRLGEWGAHVVGTLAVVLLFLLAIAAMVRWIVPSLETDALLRLGIGWTVATIVFEFGFGRFVMHNPWSRLLHDYNIFAGRIWILVLLTLLLGPWLLGRARAGG